MRLFSSTVRWILPADFSSAILRSCGSFRGWGDDSWWGCFVAPLGSTAGALALKDRFRETFFSPLCCHRRLGRPGSHHTTSAQSVRTDLPLAGPLVLLSQHFFQTKHVLHRFFPFWSCWGFKGLSQEKKKVFSVFCLHPLLTMCCRSGTTCHSLIQNVFMVVFQTIHALIVLSFWSGLLFWRSPTARSMQAWRWMLSDTLAYTLAEGALWQLPELGVFQHRGQSRKVPHWFAFP